MTKEVEKGKQEDTFQQTKAIEIQTNKRDGNGLNKIGVGK